jgi:hypothetical protein
MDDRLEKYVERIPFSGCWIWMGAISKAGYALTHDVSGKTETVHRLVNKTPAGMQTRHTCDIRCCVNPDHLLTGTHMDNMNDRDSRGRNIYGEKSSGAKLSDDLVAEIRNSVVIGSGVSGVNATAKRLGVAPSLISDVVNRKRWKHV